MSTRDVVILAAARSAIGTFNGSLAELEPGQPPRAESGEGRHTLCPPPRGGARGPRPVHRHGLSVAGTQPRAGG